MIKYIVILVGLTVLIGGLVPFSQYIYITLLCRKKVERLLFSQALLDFDMDEIKYENVHTENTSLVGRQALANRGWVRCPNGTIMNNDMFENKKKKEYEIELP